MANTKSAQKRSRQSLKRASANKVIKSNVEEMFEQISDRYGVVNKIISVPNHPKNDEEIVSLYESQITSKTKLIMVCHMINITGQILPIKKICEMAHGYGVEVMVDGAHCVGHFDFSIDDFNCDYYGSSLHKWLATPLGAGLLYVNKNKTHRTVSYTHLTLPTKA